jgi:small subunit ribosomal protein S4
MARYTGPLCKLCRREGKKLYLKGDRCFTTKCAFERRPYVPGQHGPTSRAKLTQYGMQLRTKQTMKRIYGVLEKQFRNYFEEARKKDGVTGDNLVKIVESRLDNIVFRMGFASSRNVARQLVTHGHFKINGKKATIPSMRVRPDDVIELREKSRSMSVISNAIAGSKDKGTAPWLDVDFDKFQATCLRYPELEEAGLPIDVQSIVELYSK